MGCRISLIIRKALPRHPLSERGEGTASGRSDSEAVNKNKAAGCVAPSNQCPTSLFVGPSGLFYFASFPAGVPPCSTPACVPSPLRGSFSALFRLKYGHSTHKPIIINRLHQNHTDFDTVLQPSHFQTFNGPTPSYVQLYVQYLYNICTFTIVQVLYNYCTYIVQRPVLVRSAGIPACHVWECGNVGMRKCVNALMC